MGTGSKILLTFIFSISLLQFINAQVDIPACSHGDIKFYVDQTCFAGKENLTYVEFYFMIYADQLKLIEENDSSFGTYKMNIEIRNRKSDFKIKKEWTTKAFVKIDSTNLKSLVIYDQFNESLSPGDYEVQAEIKDVNNNHEDKIEYSFTAPTFSKDFSASQLQFSAQISEDKNTQFSKGNYSIIPNPSRRYGVLNPILYFYYELYNIEGTENLKINYSLYSKDGKLIKSYPETTLKKHTNSATLIQGLNVAKIETGVYEFKAYIENLANKSHITLSRDIEIIQMDYLTTKPALSSEDADEAGKLIKYIAAPDQYNIYEKLALSGKAQFLINFWKDLDPTPNTLENEYLEKIKQRFNYANEKFKWAKVEGWSTDRGRVLIKYGMPDDIEQHYYDPDTLPYEIWKYQQDRNYEFIFVDLRSIGRFDLVHSNMEGEAHNENWKSELQKF